MVVVRWLGFVWGVSRRKADVQIVVWALGKIVTRLGFVAFRNSF